MQIRNVSPYGDLDTPLLGQTVVFGEVVDVTPEQAEALLPQFENWAPVDKPAVTVTATCVADQQDRVREVTGEPSPSDLKPVWVAFAQAQGAVDPGASTKDQLITEFATEFGDPATLATEMADRGAELAQDATAPSEPPPVAKPPAGTSDEGN